MKHFFNLVLTFLVLISTADAQTSSGGWRIGFGMDAGIPTSKAFNGALGADIRLQKQFSDRVAGTLTAGFTHYFEKDHYADLPQYSSPFNVIPVKAGVKLFLADHLYVGGEAGAGFGMEEWGTSFLWSPSLGLAFSNGIDLSIKYEDYTRNAATKDVALRLAYGIPARKVAHNRKNDTADGWRLNVAIDPGSLTDDFGRFTLGADVSLQNRLSNNLEAVASAGILHYFGKSYNYYLYNPALSTPAIVITQAERDVIPAEAGLRLYAGKQFYLQGQAGAGFGLNGTTSFMYTPSLGLTFSNGLDVGARYDNFSSRNIRDVLSLKLGYNLKL